MRVSKALRTLLTAVCIATGIASNSLAVGLRGACDTACDENCCDGLSSSRIRQDIVPGMFGDGGLVIPRANVSTRGLRLIFQNHAYKVAENNSALPQDRIGFNFNAMQDVYNGFSDRSVYDNIYEYRLFGEKTFLDGLFSVDLMLPFYTTSTHEYDPLDAVLNGPGTENTFGDLAFGFNALIHESCNSACSLGLRVEAPTGEDIVSPPILRTFYSSFEDDVWNFTPYVANLWTPSDRTFVQSFLSYRLTSSSITEVENDPVTIREQSYFMADVSVGYWLYRNRCGSCLTGLVPTVELHYTGAWDKESAFSQTGGEMETISNRIYGHTDRLSLTAGVSAFFGPRCSAGIAVAAPLRSKEGTSTNGEVIDSDRAYDWALLTQLTYYFGR